MTKFYTRGPRKNAILRSHAPSKYSRISVATFRLNNLYKKIIKNYFYDLYLNIKKLN